tara:strand:+ start:431 stop:1201 length:771 start_codon:yes stop_codon:yes gene_type:complete
MQRVHLMGELSQFGSYWETDCTSLGDISRLIDCQNPRWRPWLIQKNEEGMQVRIVKGSEVVVDPNELLIQNNLLKDQDIYMTAVPAGSGKAGKILGMMALMILAVPLMGGFAAMGGAGFTAGFTSTMGSMGLLTATTAGGFALTIPGLLVVNLALGGIAAMLSQGPETEYDPNADDTPADKIFNGPVNVTKQNIPIPILYGELIVGGVVISGNYKLMEEVAQKSTVDTSQDATFDLFAPLSGSDKLSNIAGGYTQA